jgi:acetoin utilization deacetylase AcuC-like enzyme
VEVREATRTELERAHEPAYLDALDRALAGGSGFLDADTFTCPGSRDAVLRAAGGAVELVRTLTTGRADVGFALQRPPGHHACPDRAMGFCMVNHVAVAAAEALASGLERVAIVDWDVHHGNGTQALFEADPRVLFVSLHQWPLYPGTGRPDEIGIGAAAGTVANIAMPSGTGSEAYGLAFRAIVLPLLRSFAPGIVLVSAGFDAHARDPLAGLELDTECYGAMASALLATADELGHGRVAFFLEGGYDLDALEASVAAVGRAICGERTDLPEGAARAREIAAIERTLRALRS